MGGLYILSKKISWPQSTGFYLLFFLQRNTVVFNYLLDFPLWVFVVRSMAQWERATSLPSPSPHLRHRLISTVRGDLCFAHPLG